MTTIEEEILNIINTAIEGKYIGKLKVINDEGFWTLFIYLDQEMSPLVMSYEGDYEKFKDFIYNEFKTRQMQRVSFWKAVKIYPNLDDKENEFNYRDLML